MARDDFLELFDLFVNWPARIAKEGPFVEKILRESGARTVLDAGCGPGHHSVYLARKGFEVFAEDNASCMIEETGRQAMKAGVAVKVLTCSFEDIRTQISGQMDAVLVLGNSLCMVEDRPAASRALESFAAALKQGGLLLVHCLNYDGLRRMGKRVSRPNQVDGVALVLKFFDLEPGATRVNIVRMSPEKPGLWKSEHSFADLLDLSKQDVIDLAAAAGFSGFKHFGSAGGEEFNPEKSYDLFLLCFKR